jgi:regulation of enolase protein 1 (concanavalin A-like superfamily)
MIQQVTADFRITTRVTIHPVYNYQGAGLLIWRDTENYIRLERTLVRGIDMIGRVNGDRPFAIEIPFDVDTVYLRLERLGDRVDGWYSTDGTSWSHAGDSEFPSGGSLDVGLVLINEWQDNPISADFDFFRFDSCTPTCSVSNARLFKQGASPWGDDPYGEGGVHLTIADKGCALTSAAMMISQQGAYTTPGDLNTWLQSHAGYKGPSVNWVEVGTYARIHGVTLYYHGRFPRTSSTDDELETLVCEMNTPVVLDVSGLGGTDSHFVLATGRDSGGSWAINDPAFNRSSLASYGNTYRGLRVFHPIPVPVWQAGGSDGIEFLVTAPSGLQTGFIRETGEVIEKIERSSYYREAIAVDTDPEGDPGTTEKIFEVIAAPSGTYTIDVFGIESGDYTFHFFVYDENQDTVVKLVAENSIAPGQVHSYSLDYISEAGSPSEVHRLIGVDIKPDSTLNPVNCGAASSLIPVAILSTPEFDALSVDHSSAVFEGAREAHLNHGVAARHEEDIDGDGDIDLLLHFRLRDTTLTCSSTVARLTGTTFGGIPILGTDAVTIVPNGGD